MEVEHGLSESRKGDSFLCHTLAAKGRFTSQSHTLYTTGLILVAQMFCSGRWHIDPLGSWSAGIYCILEEPTEKRDGAHSYKCIFSVKSPSTIKNIYIFTSLDKQGNWGKDKHWCLSKFHPVSWRDRNKKNLLRTKIPSLRQPSLFSTRRLAVSNYNTPDLLLGTWLLKVLGWLDEQLFSTKVSSPHTSRSGNKRLESCLCCLAQVHRETHPACLCSARYSQDTNW